MTYGEFAISKHHRSAYLACNAVVDELRGRHYDDLTPGELIFWLTWQLVARDIHFYFSVGGTFYARKTLAALQQIGATQLANHLQSAIDIVGLPDPMPEKYDYEPSPEQKAALEQIRVQLPRSAWEELYERLFCYLKRHISQFSRPNATLTREVLLEQLLPTLEIEGKPIVIIVRLPHGFGQDGRRVHERDFLIEELQLRMRTAQAKQQTQRAGTYREAVEQLRCVPDEEGVSQWDVTDSNRSVRGYSTPQRLIWIWPEGLP